MRIFQINETNGNLLNNLNRDKGTVLFYHPQCSHCIAMKPMWEEMKEKLKNKNCDIYEVNGEDLLNIQHPIKNTINGFPTILNVDNGKLNHFEKERNTQNMIEFALSNLAKNIQDRKKASNSIKKRKLSFHINKNGDLMKKRRIMKKSKLVNSRKLLKNKLNKNKRVKSTKKSKNKPKVSNKNTTNKRRKSKKN